MSKLTEKEVSLIGDLLNFEEMAFKKAQLYSNTLTDASLAAIMSDIATKHQQRFKSLLELL